MAGYPERGITQDGHALLDGPWCPSQCGTRNKHEDVVAHGGPSPCHTATRDRAMLASPRGSASTAHVQVPYTTTLTSIWKFKFPPSVERVSTANFAMRVKAVTAFTVLSCGNQRSTAARTASTERPITNSSPMRRSQREKPLTDRKLDRSLGSTFATHGSSNLRGKIVRNPRNSAVRSDGQDYQLSQTTNNEIKQRCKNTLDA